MRWSRHHSRGYCLLWAASRNIRSLIHVSYVQPSRFISWCKSKFLKKGVRGSQISREECSSWVRVQPWTADHAVLRGLVSTCFRFIFFYNEAFSRRPDDTSYLRGSGTLTSERARRRGPRARRPQPHFVRGLCKLCRNIQEFYSPTCIMHLIFLKG